MDTIHEAGTTPVAMTREEREKVREQLNRLLETHHFKNSKRYPPLLRFIVEETLEGRGEFLKERLLGFRVFDRPADYDTAADPIVRVTIAEIRKRIAQYYHDEEHDAEIRIELLPGRYAPEFRFRNPKRDPLPPPPSAAEMAELSRMGVPVATAPATRLERLPARPGRLYVATAAAALLGVLLTLFAPPFMRWLKPSALETFWSPILASTHPVLFCLPTDVGKKRGPAGDPAPEDSSDWNRRIPSATPGGPTFLDFEALGENVVFSDMLAAMRVSNVLAINHRDYTAKLTVYTNLDDLRQGPAVLIGGLDNQWTMRALAPLRYHFAGSDEDRYWIADARNPDDRSRSLDLKLHLAAVTRDYAIVARLHNEQTGQPEMIVAGIGMSGTAAAGEFITDEHRMRELRQRIGPGFKDRDFEAVLSTDVVNGSAGSPRIIAISVW
jgi:hypothetical protein